jgi:hypothetical protein
MIDWRGIAVLPLIFLGGAAGTQGDCARSGSMHPGSASLNLQGRPNPLAGLAAETIGRPPAPAMEAVGCGATPLPATVGVTNLRDETGDVLHGLPPSDILRRIDEPPHAPAIQ